MADHPLSGHRVLAIATNYGVEQDELVVPTEHVRDEGAEVTIAAALDEPIVTLVGDKDPGRTVRPTTTFDKVDPADFDLLLIPGGTINADALRQSEEAIGIVRSFVSSGRPVAAICHGPWALVEADAVRGKTLTSYASLRTDIGNAGAASWVDEPVVSDRTGGWTLVTSRTPDDLDAFVAEVDKALTGTGR
ncbi:MULTISPECIES: type 1 glutamine amidotransferase domain-containing protein [unclassified Streptomyces]|uniref:type 1 glutamine amidotransferase domain-containing protein n=1 Tax=unclassified Streptomyces TaxID=2593676 RepID=UPI00381A6336